MAGTNKRGKVTKMPWALKQPASLALPRFLQGVFNHTVWGPGFICISVTFDFQSLGKECSSW